MAGELATEYGVSGWAPGQATETEAAQTMFRLWQSQRRREQNEPRQVLEQLADFIDRHGDSRFSPATATMIAYYPVRDRAGWWDNDAEDRVYLFTAEGMREALKGFDFDRALDVLEQAGVIPPPDEKGRRPRQKKIGGKNTRVHLVDPDALLASRDY
jgi:putative DNA primase/helicase